MRRDFYFCGKQLQYNYLESCFVINSLIQKEKTKYAYFNGAHFP